MAGGKEVEIEKLDIATVEVPVVSGSPIESARLDPTHRPEWNALTSNAHRECSNEGEISLCLASNSVNPQGRALQRGY